MPRLNCLGIEIYYCQQGEGPPLLLLHGLGSSHLDWHAQIDFFSSHYTVITIDFPLHGESKGTPAQFSIPFCADICHEFIRQMGLSSVSVVGVSMGGMVGFELAARYGKQVKSLVMVNALAECKARQPHEWYMLWIRYLMLNCFPIRTVARLMAAHLLPNNDQVEKDQAAMRWSRNERRIYIDCFNQVVGWSGLHLMPKIKCPLLLVSAEFDYTSPGSKKVLAALYPQASYLCLNGLHHIAPLESPNVFNEAVQRWLLNTHLHDHASVESSICEFDALKLGEFNPSCK